MEAITAKFDTLALALSSAAIYRTDTTQVDNVTPTQAHLPLVPLSALYMARGSHIPCN
jgi:hypothetical protein